MLQDETVLRRHHHMTTRPQMTSELSYECRLIGDLRQHLQGDDHVEGRRAKVQVHEIAGYEGDLRQAMLGSGQHLIRQVGCRQTAKLH